MRTPLAVACAALALPLALSGCTTPTSAADQGRLILATSDDLGEFNPVAGYSSNGVSPLYEGLLRPAAVDDLQLPELEPALAADAPQVSDDGRTWTVRLREGVRFHDGTDLDSSDVAATYRAVIDPDSASPIADDYQLIDRIDTPDPLTVQFHLDAPNREFTSRLLLGIAPSERLDGGPATDSDLNTDPAGTGPFLLENCLRQRRSWSPTPTTGTAPPSWTRWCCDRCPTTTPEPNSCWPGRSTVPRCHRAWQTASMAATG